MESKLSQLYNKKEKERKGGGRKEGRKKENNGVFGGHKANINQALFSKGI